MVERDEGNLQDASSGVASTSGSDTEKKDMPTVILVIGEELSPNVCIMIIPELL